VSDDVNDHVNDHVNDRERYRAIVVGGTGAVGGALVRELLASPRCERVVLLARRAVDAFAGATGNGKLDVRVVDLDALERAARDAAVGCRAAFNTMGVGQPRKVSREELWKVDVEHAAAFGRGCREAGVAHLALLGAVGANAASRSHYIKAKGAAEEALRALGFARLSLFRPSLLVTPQIRYGLQDRVTQAVFPVIAWFLPRRFHGVRVEDLGRAMRIDAEQPAPHEATVQVLHYPDVMALIRSEAAAAPPRSSPS